MVVAFGRTLPRTPALAELRLDRPKWPDRVGDRLLFRALKIQMLLKSELRSTLFGQEAERSLVCDRVFPQLKIPPRREKLSAI
jgi:hypothetical protein